MRTLSIFFLCAFSIIRVNHLSAQILSRQLLTDTVTLWSSAKFKTVDEFKKEIDEENTRYGLSRKFEEQHIVYNEKREVVFNYKNFIVTTQKVIENNSSQYFISMTFWDIIIEENVSTTMSISEAEKVVSYLNNPENISNLKNEDIISFENFKIIKSSNRFYVSIKDIYYGDRLAEILYNTNRNEFALILLKIENAKSTIDQDKKQK